MSGKKILIIGANGYIGSAIFQELKLQNFNVTGIDNYFRNDEFSFPNNSSSEYQIQNISYQNLNHDYLNQFTDCIWLAGHSSVSSSIKDEHGALRNNLFDLINFTNLFNGRLIYASSGSVYSNKISEKSNETFSTLIPKNVYDYTKIAFDNYVGATNKKAISLRFGTVNGFSHRMRKELIINSMVISSINKGYLNANNTKNFRAILFIDDLVRGVIEIIKSDVVEGIYNMASFNARIGDIAKSVSNKLDSKIEYLPNTTTYNFMLDTNKFEKDFNFNFTNDIEKIIENICLNLT